jgi:ketosteroid isomerase-like protein
MSGTSETRKIVELVEGYARAFNDKDIEAVLAWYEPGAIATILPGQLLTTPEEIRAGVVEAFELNATVSADRWGDCAGGC